MEVGGTAARTSDSKVKCKANLVISVVFLVTLGLWGGALGWRMGDVPPQEGEGVGQVQKT